MMKKLLVVLLTLPVTVFAQRSYNNLDNFTIGDKATYVDVDESGMQAGSAGANITWDFSNAALLSDTTRISILSPISTPWGSIFTSADIAERHSDGRYYYYQKTANNNFLIGFVDSSNNAVSYYNKNSTMYANRPMKYADSATDVFEDSSDFNGIPVTGGGTVKITADGYGTIKLPGNVIYSNVMRLKIYQFSADSFETSPGVKQTIIAKVSSYYWYDTISNFAIFKVDSFSVDGFFEKRARMLYKKPTNIQRLSSVNDLRCYIADGVLHIDNIVVHDGNYTVSLYDLSGRLLQAQAMKAKNNIAVNIHTPLASGVYVVRVSDNTNKIIAVKRVAVTK